MEMAAHRLGHGQGMWIDMDAGVSDYRAVHIRNGFILLVLDAGDSLYQRTYGVGGCGSENVVFELCGNCATCPRLPKENR